MCCLLDIRFYIPCFYKCKKDNTTGNSIKDNYRTWKRCFLVATLVFLQYHHNTYSLIVEGYRISLHPIATFCVILLMSLSTYVCAMFLNSIFSKQRVSSIYSVMIIMFIVIYSCSTIYFESLINNYMILDTTCTKQWLVIFAFIIAIEIILYLYYILIIYEILNLLLWKETAKIFLKKLCFCAFICFSLQSCYGMFSQKDQIRLIFENHQLQWIVIILNLREDFSIYHNYIQNIIDDRKNKSLSLDSNILNHLKEYYPEFSMSIDSLKVSNGFQGVNQTSENNGVETEKTRNSKNKLRLLK